MLKQPDCRVVRKPADSVQCPQSLERRLAGQRYQLVPQQGDQRCIAAIAQQSYGGLTMPF